LRESLIHIFLFVYFILFFCFFFYFSFTNLLVNNRSNGPNLDEYVDILQVQQLLLENSSNPGAATSQANSTLSPPSTSTPSTTANSSSIKSRPKVNVQKAAEYSACNQLQGNKGPISHSLSPTVTL
jgi:la-related protein 1